MSIDDVRLERDDLRAENNQLAVELADALAARDRDIAELRGQVRNLQLAVARLEGAAKPTKKEKWVDAGWVRCANLDRRLDSDG